MRLSIYLIQSTLFQGEVKSVTLGTPQGQITVLHDHEPLISLVEYGDVWYVDAEGERHKISFPGGIVEVHPSSEVVLLAKEI
ncbi:MAG TPA: F0F1 ATP synthase subunit epsilon [Candidatus Paceibacterota bacterium]